MSDDMFCVRAFAEGPEGLEVVLTETVGDAAACIDAARLLADRHGGAQAFRIRRSRDAASDVLTLASYRRTPADLGAAARHILADRAGPARQHPTW